MSLLDRLPSANIKRLEMGRGTVNGLGADFGRYVVVTMPVPWSVTAPQIGKPPIQVLEVQDVDLEHAQALEAQAPACDTVVAIGGGQAMDMGKYLAWKRGCPLVTIPTIVSTNAYVTQAVGVRNRGRVEYIGEVTPELVVIAHQSVRRQGCRGGRHNRRTASRHQCRHRCPDPARHPPSRHAAQTREDLGQYRVRPLRQAARCRARITCSFSRTASQARRRNIHLRLNQT